MQSAWPRFYLRPMTTPCLRASKMEYAAIEKYTILIYKNLNLKEKKRSSLDLFNPRNRDSFQPYLFCLPTRHRWLSPAPVGNCITRLQVESSRGETNKITARKGSDKKDDKRVVGCFVFFFGSEKRPNDHETDEIHRNSLHFPDRMTENYSNSRMMNRQQGEIQLGR